MENKEKIILGIKIHDFSWSELQDEICAILAQTKQHLICTPNPEICLAAAINKKFRAVLNSATINIPDGIGLKIGACILGQWLKNRITGVDLTVKLCKIAEQKNCSIMFIGGAQNISNLAAQNMRAKFPKLKIAGELGLTNCWMNNAKLFYDTIENEALIKKINAFNPAILCVALGAPKQEFWLADNLAQLPSVKLAVGIGGTLDYLSERIIRAPKFFQKFGFEWLFRLIVEPQRCKRIFNAIIKFPILCIIWRARQFFTYNKNYTPIILNETGKILVVKEKNSTRWTLPKFSEKNIEKICENITITQNQLVFLNKRATIMRRKYPRLIQLLLGRRGSIEQFYLLKFLGNSRSLTLLPDSRWSVYQWQTREILQENLEASIMQKIKRLLK